MVFSFFGGVHPEENKSLSFDKPIQVFPEPDVLVVPMSQHIGAPCKPLVKKGDSVTVGQKIGDNTGLCVPVHSPVSGKVKAVEMKAHSSGRTMMSVVIENDHAGTLCPEIHPRTQEQVDALTAEELMERLGFEKTHIYRLRDRALTRIGEIVADEHPDVTLTLLRET